MGKELKIKNEQLKTYNSFSLLIAHFFQKDYNLVPEEDREALFRSDFLMKDGSEADIPYFANKRGYYNNLEAYKSKILHYEIPTLHKGDRIVSEMFVILAKPSCVKATHLDKKWQKPILMKRVEIRVK